MITSFFKRTEASATTIVTKASRSLKRGAAGDSPAAVEGDTAVEVVEAASVDVSGATRGASDTSASEIVQTMVFYQVSSRWEARESSLWWCRHAG
jgi:hypothetical protein